MDLSYKQEVTVGGLVIAAIALFLAGTTWLGGRSIGGRSGEYWRIQFRDVNGLKTSSPIRVSGVAVGRVEDIYLEAPGKVIVAVSLAKNIVPRTDAAAQVVAVGFVGDAAVDFFPGQAAEPLPKDRTILGTQAQGLTDRAAQLGYRADTLLIGLLAIANQRTADQLHQTLVALQGTLKASQRMMDLYANPRQGPTAELTKTMESLQKLSARLDTTLANPAFNRLLNHSDTLTRDLSAMAKQFAATGAQLDSTLKAINSGQGTFGKFARDTTLFYEMKNFMQSATRFMDDLQKHPGKISPTIKFCC